MSKSTVLVTGVAGFIGSHVADHCIAAGYHVIGLDDLSGGFAENVPDGVEFIEGSITDGDLLKTIFNKHTIDYVYHLGAYAAEGLSHFIRAYNYRTNLIGSVLLINQAVLHDVKCFVFASSIAVYGPNQTPMHEDLTPLPEDPYGVSKYAVELDLMAARNMFGLNYVVFRPHNVYGERQNIADKYRNVIGIFMNQVMKGEPMSVFGDGLQTRAFSYIDDVAPIIAQAPGVRESYGNVFNVGADKPYSILELAEEIACAFGVKADIRHLPERKEVVHAFASHDRVREVFEPPEATTLSRGISRMAAWVQVHGPMTPVEFDNIEVSTNLPSSWQKR